MDSTLELPIRVVCAHASGAMVSLLSLVVAVLRATCMFAMSFLAAKGHKGMKQRPLYHHMKAYRERRPMERFTAA